MAHLINAKAMRLGWEQDWSDIWFSEDAYYCEYLYSCFRIRYFLIYTYFNRTVDKFGLIYSHFFIFFDFRVLSVFLFLYDSRMELSFDKFTLNYYNFIKNYLMRKRWRKKSNEYWLYQNFIKGGRFGKQVLLDHKNEKDKRKLPKLKFIVNTIKLNKNNLKKSIIFRKFYLYENFKLNSKISYNNNNDVIDKIKKKNFLYEVKRLIKRKILVNNNIINVYLSNLKVLLQKYENYCNKLNNAFVFNQFNKNNLVSNLIINTKKLINKNLLDEKILWIKKLKIKSLINKISLLNEKILVNKKDIFKYNDRKNYWKRKIFNNNFAYKQNFKNLNKNKDKNNKNKFLFKNKNNKNKFLFKNKNNKNKSLFKNKNRKNKNKFLFLNKNYKNKNRKNKFNYFNKYRKPFFFDSIKHNLFYKEPISENDYKLNNSDKIFNNYKAKMPWYQRLKLENNFKIILFKRIFYSTMSLRFYFVFFLLSLLFRRCTHKLRASYTIIKYKKYEKKRNNIKKNKTFPDKFFNNYIKNLNIFGLLLICKNGENILKIKDIFWNFLLSKFSISGKSYSSGKRKNISMLIFFFLYFFKFMAAFRSGAHEKIQFMIKKIYFNIFGEFVYRIFYNAIKSLIGYWCSTLSYYESVNITYYIISMNKLMLFF